MSVKVNKEIKQLIGKLKKGDKSACARLITFSENYPEFKSIIDTLVYPFSEKSYYLGITGSPGVGKSSLISSLITEIRKNKKTVGVLAVDPSSPFSGGAILGDRVRMQKHFLDKGVYIRSMASRGKKGGLSYCALAASRIIANLNMNFVIFETLGVGQQELDIIEAVDTKIVVIMPNSGDVIQMLKAGIMEIADILVISKSDIAGATDLRNEILNNLILKKNDGWEIKIILTSALNNSGFKELYNTILEHKVFLEEKKLISEYRNQRLKKEVFNTVIETIEKKININLNNEKELNKNLNNIKKGKKSIQEFAEEIIKNLKAEK